jgi:16S rRNA (cytosine1402-N4)-methyltransferase
MSQPAHVSVLLREVVEALEPAPGKRIVDATFGAGGYSRAFLDAGAEVIAFDRDPTAAEFAAPLIATGRFRLVQDRFSAMERHLDGRCEGVAFDLGVSSMQLDEADRGFSFMRDGPLDMRMERAGLSAADLVNGAEQAELARIFWVYGEERQSRRIAAALVRRRGEAPFTRTLDLADTVERALGGRRGAKTHPATRVFQALRIAVNAELAELEAGLDAAERVLAEGGRLAVVTFHSLEDRIVKAFFTERAGRTAGGSRHLPPAAAGPRPTFELLFNGARGADEAETDANPRARSAKLRAGVRTDAPAWRQAA